MILLNRKLTETYQVWHAHDVISTKYAESTCFCGPKHEYDDYVEKSGSMRLCSHFLQDLCIAILTHVYLMLTMDELTRYPICKKRATYSFEGSKTHTAYISVAWVFSTKVYLHIRWNTEFSFRRSGRWYNRPHSMETLCSSACVKFICYSSHTLVCVVDLFAFCLHQHKNM